MKYIKSTLKVVESDQIERFKVVSEERDIADIISEAATGLYGTTDRKDHRESIGETGE